jgi:hypothetical protein
MLKPTDGISQASREYGGIHYHFDTTASQEVCPKVAGYIFGNFMRPKRD